MDDVIRRRAAIDALIWKIRPHNNGDGTIMMCVMSEELVRETLNNLPSAQPEVIKCKNCMWYNDRERTCNDLMGFGRHWKPDDFCSYGKRRTNDLQ